MQLQVWGSFSQQHDEIGFVLERSQLSFASQLLLYLALHFLPWAQRLAWECVSVSALWVRSAVAVSLLGLTLGEMPEMSDLSGKPQWHWWPVVDSPAEAVR